MFVKQRQRQQTEAYIRLQDFHITLRHTEHTIRVISVYVSGGVGARVWRLDGVWFL